MNASNPSNSLRLTHYDPSEEIIVAADVSKYGLGAVIMQRFPTGERCHYGHVEKEALALIFAATCFLKMLYGRHSLLQTDQQPRLKRLALTLLLYDFDIKHVSTTNFGYAGFLLWTMSSQRRPDEDYVIAVVYVESEAKAILEETLSNAPDHCG
ncbi:uncharacterized protein LOC134288894 [Aedes albopictus]|uniref:Reverse transcriptase RNase H-like domain-containing protein n=1 Tax=Aedes albopictus TaxID=7160 RepID=A0ABM1YTT8_AEDAL